MEFQEVEKGRILVCENDPELSDKLTERLRGLAVGCEEELEEMLEEAKAVASLKALYSVAEKKDAGENAVAVNGVVVTSKLMRTNFSGLSRVFPFVCTSGEELERWSEKYSEDPLASYWADEIKKAFLYAFVPSFQRSLMGKYAIKGRLPAMNPGSLEKEWSISGQTELFSMLGGREAVKQYTGVILTDSFLMLPSKSVSGIYFETETDYENCKLCPRASCPNRRAKYEENAN